MSGILDDINYDSIEASQPGDGPQPVEPGTYHAIIESAVTKPTSKGTGQYLEIQWKILDDGPSKNRTLYTRLNLRNPNQTAVDIARSELKAITEALGIFPQKESEFVNRVCKLEVGVEKRKDEPTKLTNRIKKYVTSTAPANPALEKPVTPSAGSEEETPF